MARLGVGLGVGLRPPSTGGVGAWSPLSLFANGEKGVWYDPSDPNYVFTDSGLGSKARFNGNVKGVLDRSPNARPAVQTAPTSTIRYYRDRETTKPYVAMALGTDALNVALGSSLGSACTVVYIDRGGIEIHEGVTVGTSFALTKHFWQFLLIDRPLTSDEKAALMNAWKTKGPSYRDTYQVHVRANGGNDANDGLTYATAKATILAGHTVLRSLPAGAAMAIWPGTYTTGWQLSTSALAKAQSVHCPEGGVIIDLGETPNVGLGSGIAIDTPDYDLRLYANGNLKITNVGNNAIGSAAGTTRVYDALIDNAYDGTSAHTGTVMLATIGCTFKNCLKGALTHVGVCGVYHEHCVFFSKIGSVLGIGSINRGVSGDPGYGDMAHQCDFVPDPDITTVWSSFYFSMNSTDVGAGFYRKLTGCRLGAPHRTPTATPGASVFFDVTLEDCYFNGVYYQGDAPTSTVQFTRCFGRLTVRMRRTAASITNLDNCALLVGTVSGRILSGDVYTDPTDVFGSGRVRNSILKGAATAIYALSNPAVMNANWSFLNNCFHGNTLNYTSGVTPDGTDLLADPLLVNPTTDEFDDWRVAANSPCIGAGVAGANIGIGVAA